MLVSIAAVAAFTATLSDRLGIAHYVFDHESRFRDSVIDQFADDYANGRTPIPCVQCNMGVKFTDLLSLSRELGADCLATGHYVRRAMGPDGAELHRAADPARDQSYFLFATTRDQLDYLRFPLGDLPKAQVRELAREIALPVAASDRAWRVGNDSIHLYYNDLDLNSAASRAQLLARVERAAKKLCRDRSDRRDCAVNTVMETSRLPKAGLLRLALTERSAVQLAGR